MSLHDTNLNYPTKHCAEGEHSRTSTLSSGYQSGSIDSDFEDIASTFDETAHTHPDYFLLEADAYVTLDENADYRLHKVKESMMKIITDLQSLGFETSLEDLTRTVKKSTPKPSACSRRISDRRNSRAGVLPISQPHLEPLETSPVDELFKEIQYNTMNNQCNEKLYSRLISNLAMDCLKDDPIYEEIKDDCEFDDVLHSKSYQRSQSQTLLSKPPALPPRPKPDRTFRRATCHELPLLSSKPNSRKTSAHSLTEVEKVKYRGEGKRSSWMHYPPTRCINKQL